MAELGQELSTGFDTSNQSANQSLFFVVVVVHAKMQKNCILVAFIFLC